MLRALNTGHLPHNVAVFRPAERKNSSIDKIALYAKYWTLIDGKPTVLVCQNDSCRISTKGIRYQKTLHTPKINAVIRDHDVGIPKLQALLRHCQTALSQ